MKVQLKIPPWIANMLNEQESGWLILDKEMGEGATIGDLLTELAVSYPDFRKAVFNPDLGKVNSQLIIVINGSVLQSPDAGEAKLDDGDSISFLPVFDGG